MDLKKTTLALLLLTQCWLATLAQQTVGLFLNDSLSQNGFTLFSNNKTTYLVDNCGRTVRTWQSDFTTNSGLYLLENGNLLRSCRIGGTFNAGGVGGRIELFSWEGDLLWAYNYASDDYHQHHDICPLPNGNFLLLAWERRTQPEAIQAGRNPDLLTPDGLWPEKIVEVEMVGSNGINVVWEWRLWDHLVQDFDPDKDNFGSVAGHPERVNINFVGNIGGPGIADWIHANSLAYHPDLDQIAVTSRTFSEIWIIDHSTTTTEAAGSTGGNAGKGGDLLYRWGNPQAYDRGTPADQILWGPHYANWIPAGYPNEGKLLVFNNGFNRPGNNFSSVDMWEAPLGDQGYLIEPGLAFGPSGPAWSYTAAGFYAGTMSGAHALPNGNVFICQSTSSRFFEITPNHQIVWEYISPSSGFGPIAQGQTNNSVTFRATRYPASYPAFEGKYLSPGSPVELNPLPSDCTIFDGSPTSTNVRAAIFLEGVRLRNNPVGRSLFIENLPGNELVLEIRNAVGTSAKRTTVRGLQSEVDVSGLPKGFYILQLFDTKTRNHFNLKFIKN